MLISALVELAIWANLTILMLSFPSRALRLPSSQRIQRILAFPKPPVKWLHVVPTTSTCPDPACFCAETPPGLVIDQTKPLNGTAVSYAHHVLIATGKSNWTSKIEDEKDNAAWGRFTADVKTAIGPKGPYHKPTYNVMVSTSSFSNLLDPSFKAKPSASISNVVLFPAFKYLRNVSLNEQSVSNLVQGFLVSENLPPTCENARPQNQFQAYFGKEIHNITTPTILICSHNSRDSRCGILGPLLRDEFARQLENLSIPVSTDLFIPRVKPSHDLSKQDDISELPVNIGCISHIGGHVWAGNVIIYIPPGFSTKHTWERHVPLLRGHEGPGNALGGMGIWYGRVEPRHVEGIVHETLLKGNVISDMFRGGIDRHGTTIRL